LLKEREMHKAHWTLALVALALFASGLACSIEITTAHVRSATLVRDEAGESRTSTYAPADTFYLVVDLANASDDNEVRVTWVQVGAGEDGGDRVIGEETIRSGSGKILFSATHPQQQWPVGNYRVEVYLNGTQTHTVPFTVQF
jgi:hypothetical protein